MVPSMGGGTKLIRTLLPGRTEGVCSGTGDGAGDPSAEVESPGDSSGRAEGVVADGSCARTAREVKITTTSTKLLFAVMSSVSRDISFSQRISRDSSTSLGMTNAKHSNASSPWEKCYRAIRTRAEIPHRLHL